MTTWVCNKCYEIMEVTRESKKRSLVFCPNCGNEYYIDNDDEIINDGYYDEDYDEDFELANFCRGGDLTED